LDPQTTKDGEPYGPHRYKEIVQECYYISKIIHTSYTDLMKITPIERSYLLTFMIEDSKKEKEAYEKLKQNKKY